MGVIPPGASGPTNYPRQFGVGPGGADRLSLAQRSEANLTELLKSDANSELFGAFSNFNDGLASTLMNVLTGAGSMVLGGAMELLRDLMSLRWSQVDEIADGQLALNGQVELLSPLQDYGSVYALGSSGVLVVSTGTAPFDRQVGPMTGCHMASGGIVLDDYGLWDIRCRMAFSWIEILSDKIEWEVRVVRHSDGAVFSQQKDYVRDPESTTREIVTTVVIPNDGYKYRVEAYISMLAPGREVFGGPAQNRLTVQHITRSTSFQI